MDINENFSDRSKMLLFSTLELLRKEIRPKFADWKDADDWLFAQLDFTKDELTQIYIDRGINYYDGSAVDLEAAQNTYESMLPDFAKSFDKTVLGESLYLGNIKFFLGDEGHIFCKLPDENEARHLRSRIQDIKEGDAFFYGEDGVIRTTSEHAHQNFDEHDEPWIVYGDDGAVYFEEDIGTDIYGKVSNFLISLSRKEIQSSFMSYKDWRIFEQDGVYTIGGKSSYDFLDCTLENLSPSVDELVMVAWCRNNGIDLRFDDLRNVDRDVSYDDYLRHLKHYQDDKDDSFLSNEFIVPIVVFSSIEDAKRFADWLHSKIYNLEQKQEKESLNKQIEDASERVSPDNSQFAPKTKVIGPEL